MQDIIFLPLIIPLVTTIVCFWFWNKPFFQRWIFFCGATLNLAASVLLLSEVNTNGYVTAQLGQWAAPAGITLIADLFSALMVLITSVLTFIFFIYSKDSIDKQRMKSGFYPMIMLLVSGITGSFLTGDIFNLYVWFEVMVMASFVLITLGGTRTQLEGGVKYVAINFIASSIFLTGVGVVYGIAGTLNMADLAVKLPQIADTGFVALAACFFLICFGIKSAIFPLYFWLPASYHTPPVEIISLIAGLLTKVGVYALIRFFTLIFVSDLEFITNLLLISAGITMLSGVLGAIVQNDLKKLLSFHIISQIGYMILGLAFYSPMALTGVIFFIVHNILVKTNLFFLAGISEKIHGTFSLKDSGGLYKNFPVISLIFALSALSLAGIPPFSGFWGKFMIVKAGLDKQSYFLVAISLWVSIFTLFSMTKIWTYAFLNKNNSPLRFNSEKDFRHPSMILSVILMSGLIFSMAVTPRYIIDFSNRAAKQLLDRKGYIQAVLGQ